MNDTKPSSAPTQAPSSRRKHWPSIIIGLVLLSVVAGLLGAKAYEMGHRGMNDSLTSPMSPKEDGNKIITDNERNISDIAAKVAPSVVSVVTESSRNSVFSEQGAGTGVVVSKDGVIMTNNHVVSGANSATVVLSDGTTHENASVIGSDPLNDIAFLKVRGVSNLTAATLGNSSTVRVGQEVIAIGNSLGQYQNTVTSGILSATGRPVSARDGDSVENLTDLLQTDAAINPGNSGGPLLNLAGQVIGINTAIAEDAQGIGFAIPINATKGVLKGVLAGRGVERAYIGLNYLAITADVAKHYKLSVKEGAYVHNESGDSAIVGGSPAEKAGLKNRDIITKVNGQQVGKEGGLSSLIGQYAPGDTVELTVLRGSNERKLRLTLAKYQG